MCIGYVSIYRVRASVCVCVSVCGMCVCMNEVCMGYV